MTEEDEPTTSGIASLQANYDEEWFCTLFQRRQDDTLLKPVTLFVQ